MTIGLAGPTAATTTTSGKSVAATLSFASDNSNDVRTKVYVVTAITGIATASIHSVYAPKMVMFKRPASYPPLGGYNQVSGRYSKVPKVTHRAMLKGSAQVTAGQWEPITGTLDINIPAGAVAFDLANVEASLLAFLGGIWDQREEWLQAMFDGRY